MILEPCRACEIEDDTRVPHHFTFTNDAGMAQQAPEWQSCCLCYSCHAKLHNGGEKAFWQWLGIELETLLFEGQEFYNSYYK